MIYPMYAYCRSGLLHETDSLSDFQCTCTTTYTVSINFSGARYDKIAVDVEKSSIYETDMHVPDN